MLERTIAFIGAGNMAEALIKGLLRAGTARPDSIIATGRREERLEGLRRTYGVRTLLDNVAAVREADVVVLAVKPQALDKVLLQVAPAADQKKLFISVAAGVPISVMERRLGQGMRVIRTMPNTPSLVGMGACALAPGEHASEEDMAVASRVFQSVGITTVVEENLLDAVTGLSGSGPAYIFLIIEALSDAGVKVGLPRYTAQKLAAQTVLGSAQLLIETNAHPGQLKDQVTSPGGTAIAGLHTLEAGGLRTTLINAVEAATRRSRELGEQFLEKS
ncbi:Pyrroline-5-carboxylate reductase [Cystobacter fuscus DSM 2262]|uniref:Pyrroline-5-carboxylate reductase n=1 Tax=Cystobacter fuscus (strain ATCC 25194 / DSM 2262 / NBRC 100088 / M29) TaxID=1242864 RepID=S9QHB9_CYSF2|nr:pyrroline-5-carboxylate reductase [Cystobacter fuscus]EPX55813.1 Pyrroline-5-carboxylate reductase [Cystobacter fuscus DSM 2262]